MRFQYKANLKKRIIATLIDYSLIWVLTFLYIQLVGNDNEEGDKTVEGLLTMPIVIVWLIYFVAIEALYGATLGHQALHLQVMTVDRKAVTWSQTLKRHLLDPVDFFFYGIPALIAISKTEKHQRLGDLWAETIVVDTTDAQQFDEEITKEIEKNTSC